MKMKRLDRDGWGFSGFPYYQVRVDMEEFHGLVGLVDILSGKTCYWKLAKNGKTPVCGKGMFWLELIPDGQSRVITAKYVRKKKKIGGVKYPNSISVIYCDVIERFIYAEEDLVATFEDKYLDVIISPKGDNDFDDMDELEAAHKSGELSDEQFNAALKEGEDIRATLGADFEKTEVWCNRILEKVLELIEKYPECRIH